MITYVLSLNLSLHHDGNQQTDAFLAADVEMTLSLKTKAEQVN